MNFCNGNDHDSLMHGNLPRRYMIAFDRAYPIPGAQYDHRGPKSSAVFHLGLKRNVYHLNAILFEGRVYDFLLYEALVTVV